MEPDRFEAQMRALEYFHGVRMLPETWIVIRVDGRGFSKFTAARFKKPFDEKMHGYMSEVTKTLVTELDAIYGYTESDEISILFPPSWSMFDRELEKAVSVSAGLASASFTKQAGDMAHFDSRVWMAASDDRVVDYFRWRQSDAARCALNGWCYWTLRQEGKTVGEATAALKKQTTAAKHDLLFERGINFNELPLWQRRGTGCYWATYEKKGWDPKRQIEVMATRRRLQLDESLPMKDEYSTFMRHLLEAH